MKIIIKRTDDDFAMEAKNEDGNVINMDGPPQLGGHNSGFRPTQLLLAAVGGCSAIDVVMILKKQKQKIDSFEIEVDGEKEKVEEYSLFRDITIHFKLKGEIDLEKAERAVQLSIENIAPFQKH